MRSRPKFDPSSDFVVGRGFVVSGVSLSKGDPLDKSLVSGVRRLRQLYETGYINMLPAHARQGRPEEIETDLDTDEPDLPFPDEDEDDPDQDDEADRETLIEEYEKLAGKKPHPAIKTETLRQKVAELKS